LLRHLSAGALAALQLGRRIAGAQELRVDHVLIAAATLAPRLVYALTGRQLRRSSPLADAMRNQPTELVEPCERSLQRVLEACMRSPRPVELALLVSMLWAEREHERRSYRSMREALDRARRGIWQLRLLRAARLPGQECPTLGALTHVRSVHACALRALSPAIVPTFLAAALADRARPCHLDLVEAAMVDEIYGGVRPTVVTNPLRRLCMLVEQELYPRGVRNLLDCAQQLCDDGVLVAGDEEPMPRLGCDVRLSAASAAELYDVLAHDGFDDGDRAHFANSL
jgi:hypothetical protein